MKSVSRNCWPWFSSTSHKSLKTLKQDLMFQDELKFAEKIAVQVLNPPYPYTARATIHTVLNAYIIVIQLIAAM